MFDEGELLVESGGEETEAEVVEANVDSSSTPKKPCKGRRPLPDHLSREEKTYDLAEEEKQCPCGSELTLIGEEVSEQLDYIPAQLKVIRHVKCKYACKSCEETIKLAKAPLRPIQKSIATAGLLSHVLVSKFCNHLPLYRQSQMWEREGIAINRTTLSGWVMQCGDLLQNMIDVMRDTLLKSDYVCSDETPLNVLEIEKGQPYMWLHMSGERHKRVLIYDYHPGRKGEYASNFLAGFKGFHQSDAYGGYNGLHRREDVTAVGCMAHARRKFHDITKLISKDGAAKEILRLINQLYGIEREIQNRKLKPDIIKTYRQKHALPVLVKLKERLDYYKDKAIVGSQLSGAINYACNQWDGLTSYLQDGRLRIDNNDTERAIKPFVIGRKNWLFNNTELGARASANIFSVIETCKANKVEPGAYLRYLLDQLPQYRHKKDQLAELLPFNLDKKLLKKA